MPFGLIRIGRKIFDFKLRDWLGEWNYYLKLHNFSACSLFTGIRLASGGAGVSTANSVRLTREVFPLKKVLQRSVLGQVRSV